MIKSFVVGIMLASVLTACTRTNSWTQVRWDGSGSAPTPPEALPATKPLPVGTKELLFQTQVIDGVEIEGSYYKQISERGQAEFIDYRWMSTIPLSVRRDLLLMRAQKPFVLSYFFRAHENFDRKDLREGPVLSLPDLDVPSVLWRFVFEENDGRLHAIYVNRDMEIVLKKRLGSEFIDATAQLFPSGPLKSNIEQVLIRGLLNPLELSSSRVKLSTEADVVARPGENNELNFSVNDIRFSQVQAFFYVTQALEWFGIHLSFRLPFVLEVETQKGFPEKTNTAFYFQQKIRLGDGDGETFDKIPMDPSIVTHETLHAVIQAVAGLPYENQGGSLNEAFADFFTAVQLNNPKMAEASFKKAPFKRSIENDMKLSEVNGGLYHDSGAVSGLLWSLQKSLGRERSIEIAWQTLLRLNYFSDFNNFKNELLAVALRENSENQKKIYEEMKKRDWLD